jgi:uncharacterized protein YehS (DUF1456 family)
MTNNDILRQLRYTFDFSDDKMIEIFAMADIITTRAKVSNWLKKFEDADYLEMLDVELAIFLNGFIILKRGKKEDSSPIPENFLNNNAILKKLKIALNLRSDDIIEVFRLVNKVIGEHEITAFLRNHKQTQYRAFNDQYLRNFLHGLQLKYRPKNN